MTEGPHDAWPGLEVPLGHQPLPSRNEAHEGRREKVRKGNGPKKDGRIRGERSSPSMAVICERHARLGNQQGAGARLGAGGSGER